MAEKKKGKKRKEEYIPPGEESAVKPPKEEYSIAKWMRKNVPIKKTKFLNHNVKYFTASRAIDALLTTSKWSSVSPSPSGTPIFHTRDDVVDYLHRMLEHKFFHRARKVPVSDQELGRAPPADKKKIAGGRDEKEKDGSGKEGAEKSGKGTDAESSVVEGAAANKEQGAEKEKRKRKIRLDMHNDQRFIDSLDAYVWIYDPIPIHYWLMGAAFVLGAIGLCLFPLWPPSVRLGVYYLSVAAAGFLVFIILLVVVRLIVFCLVWMFSMGTHHLWILPNLTEDVGFFASFWPLYKYEFKGVPSNDKKSKKKKKDKNSDAEDNDKDDEVCKLLGDEGVSKTDEERSSETQPQKSSQQQNAPPTPPEGSQSAAQGNNSESESESSQRSSTGKDFEMVEEGDLDEEEDDDDDDNDNDEEEGEEDGAAAVAGAVADVGEDDKQKRA